MRRYVVLILIVGCLLLAACGGDGAPAATGASSSPTTAVAGGSAGSSTAPKLVTVVTTTTQLTDFAEAVGGRYVQVYGVLKANVDPHDYEPSPADLQQIGSAAVLVKNGVGLEKWFDDTIKSASPKGQVVDASTGVTIRKGEAAGEEAGDPHIWHDPTNAKIMVHSIEQALEKVDPAHTAEYQRNEAAYAKQLTDLDAEVKTAVAKLANKKIVTNHDAFGYYIEHYGLEFVGSIIPSFDTQAELSAQDIKDIVAKVKATGVKAIFSESSLPPKTAEAIAKEAGVKVVTGEEALFGDTLGPAGSDGDTYVKMIRHNTKEIVDNLS